MDAHRKALILFAQGARDPHWAAPFETVAAQVRALQPQAEVRLAYLELMSPTLSTAVAEVVAMGCRQVSILPLFLGSGGHVRKDLPLLIERLRSAYPNTRFTLHDAAGEHPAVIAAIAGVAADSL